MKPMKFFQKSVEFNFKAFSRLILITGRLLLQINIVDAFSKINNVLYNVNLEKRQRDLFLKASIRYNFYCTLVS